MEETTRIEAWTEFPAKVRVEGRITIPKQVRELLKINEDDLLIVKIRKVEKQ